MYQYLSKINLPDPEVIQSSSINSFKVESPTRVAINGKPPSAKVVKWSLTIWSIFLLWSFRKHKRIQTVTKTKPMMQLITMAIMMYNLCGDVVVSSDSCSLSGINNFIILK